eukprot:gene7739-15828_t
MKIANCMMILWLTGIVAEKSSPFSKFIPKFAQLSKVEEEDEEEEYDDEEDDENMPVASGILSKIIQASKVSAGIAIAGAVGYAGTKFITRILQQSKKVETVVTPNNDHMKSFKELLSEVTRDKDSGNYICLLFDCNNKISAAEDLKARQEYFMLMSNLTKSSQMSTVYVPGTVNAHLLEKSNSFAPHWKFLQSTENDIKIANALRAKLGVRAEELRIVILNPEYEVILENALDQLRVNPKGMPWPPRSLQNIIGQQLLEGNGGNITDMSQRLSGKKIALYFSASWCKPCQTFLPMLKKAYSTAGDSDTTTTSATTTTATAATSDEGDKPSETEDSTTTSTPEQSTSTSTRNTLVDANTEIILVSLDKDEDSFDSYRSTMPWPAVPFKDIRRAELQNGLQVRAIPALLVFDENGIMQTCTGVTDLISDKELKKFPWSSKLLDLSEGATVERLERGPALVALTDGCTSEEKDVVQRVMNELLLGSKRQSRLPRSPREELSYCMLSTSGKLSEAVRSLCKLPSNGEKAKATFAIVDLTSGQFTLGTSGTGAVNVEGENVVRESVENLVKAYTSYNVLMQEVDRGNTAENGAGTEE